MKIFLRIYILFRKVWREEQILRFFPVVRCNIQFVKQRQYVKSLKYSDFLIF